MPFFKHAICILYIADLFISFLAYTFEMCMCTHMKKQRCSSSAVCRIGSMLKEIVKQLYFQQICVFKVRNFINEI